MKKIIFITILVIIFAGLALLSVSSLIKIPIFSNIFYSQKISDLGVPISPEAIKSFSEKFGYTPLGQPTGDFMPGPKTIQITDIEATSWINALCEEFPELCPLKNFQVKFENGKIVSSAHIFEPIEADVTIFGEIARKDEKNIELKFEKVYLGNIPAPDAFARELEKIAENHINELLSNVGDLKIDYVEILDREAVFIGIFPFWFPANEYIIL